MKNQIKGGKVRPGSVFIDYRSPIRLLIGGTSSPKGVRTGRRGVRGVTLNEVQAHV